MDSAYHVGLSLAPHDAWNFIRAYTGKDKADFLPFEGSASLHAPEDTPLWNPQALKAPVHLVARKDESSEVIICDEPTQRFLVHFSSW